MNALPTTHAEPSLCPSVLAPDNYSYRQREWRAPKVIDPDEVILFDEPGRVLMRENGDGTCCRSHYFRVTKPPFGQVTVRVKHGGGEESVSLGYDPRLFTGLSMMDSDSRFRLLWAIMQTNGDSKRVGYEKAEARWRQAAADKRIKTRKMPGRDAVKVWIEEKIG
jgi:hypothetical protein